MPLAPRRRAAGACLALLVVLSAGMPASLAQDSRPAGPISQDVAVALVREQTDGKVVRVDRRLEGGNVVYRIRVLKPDGRVREYRVDAATGAIR
jgi:uncharacterized membrane protein YkoI